jgi:hypothetical protein
MGEAIYIGIYGSSGKRNCERSIGEMIEKAKDNLTDEACVWYSVFANQ